MGGLLNQPATTDFWKYDPEQNELSSLAEVGMDSEIFKRQSATSFVIGQSPYIGTGDIVDGNGNNVPDNQFYKYFPNLQNE